MSDYSHAFRAAAVQAEPVWHDLDGGIAKTIALATEAAKNGAKIVAFPETWIPGYPWWLWLDSVAWQSQFVVAYAQNSLEIDSPQFTQLRDAARDLGIAISLGFSERDNGSLYMAQGPHRQLRRGAQYPPQAEAHPRGALAVRRGRRIRHLRRSTPSSAGSARSAAGSTCSPSPKYAMYGQNEQLHIAAWPSFSIFEGAAYALGPEVNVAASQQYAVEGQVFVLAPTGLVGKAAQALFTDTDLKKQFLQLGGGAARIFGPDGRSLAEPLPPTKEGILYADLDFGAILAAKNAADPVGALLAARRPASAVQPGGEPAHRVAASGSGTGGARDRSRGRTPGDHRLTQTGGGAGARSGSAPIPLQPSAIPYSSKETS
jgi:aliphatic nitrilase